jgi:hypothetical protein
LSISGLSQGLDEFGLWRILGWRHDVTPLESLSRRDLWRFRIPPTVTCSRRGYQETNLTAIDGSGRDT